MSYVGQVLSIPFGQGGLHTDDPQDDIPITDLISARNVTYQNGVLEKAPGSRRWNASALPSGILAAWDYWPNDSTQRLIVVCRNGKVYRFTDAYNFSEVTATGTAPVTLNISKQVHILEAGQEIANGPKKIFIFTGVSPVQVISGDGTTRHNLTKVDSTSGDASDWSGTSHPSFGWIHRGRIFAVGNISFPHQVYTCNPSDHEDFNTSLQIVTYNVNPGEHDGNFTGFVYKGKCFLLKSRSGLYGLVEPEGVLSNSYFQKINSDFGAASIHSYVPALDDALVANSTGSITSMAAAFQLGDIKSADVLRQLRSEQYMRDTTNQGALSGRWGIYYEDKKQVYYTYQSSGGIKNDRILCIDFSRGKPMVSWYEKDQPNCLGLMRDVLRVPRPFYGSDDGYIYLLDSVDRNVAGAGYLGEFQTPHVGFGSEKNKLFDFLEVVYEPLGQWDLTAEIYIDGVYRETLRFPMAYGDLLDSFELDTDQLSTRVPRSIRKQIHGMGRRISVKGSNSGSGENFRIQKLNVYLRPAGEEQKAPSN